MRRHAVCAALAFAALAAAPAAGEDRAESVLERAKEELGLQGFPEMPYVATAPGVTATVDPTELVAGAGGEFVVAARGHPDGTLRVTLPGLFTRTAASGLRFVGEPRLVAGSGLLRQGRVVRVHAARGRAALALRNLGLPARGYRLRLEWERPDGRVVGLGRARVAVYAAPLEAEEPHPWQRLEPTDATADTVHQNESFVAVAPADPSRVVVGYNDFTERGRAGFSLSADGGASFRPLTIPPVFDVRGAAAPVAGATCCDPMLAAAASGDIWVGGLGSTGTDDNARSVIFVNRLDADAGFQPHTVALPANGLGEDKPMLTIDDDPRSPTHGRLHATWVSLGSTDVLSSGAFVVVSHCDTNGQPPRCDDAENWSEPLRVTPEGSYQLPDVAVTPDGTVHVVFWDYSAENAVRGVSCRAVPRTACGTSGSFGEPGNVAVLDKTLGQLGVPFACPTPAAPGGRMHPVPSVETDPGGRTWVAWTDLRGDSGQTTCNPVLHPGALPNQRTWDPFVAASADGLPRGSDAAATSAEVGTRVSDDAGTGPAGTDPDNADDFHPWLAVDRTTGQAWIDWYTTRGDAARTAAHFQLASLRIGGDGRVAVGHIHRLSATPSTYSDSSCCNLGNDYGDYTGLAAARGIATGVWISRAGPGDDGDVLVASAGSLVPGLPPRRSGGGAGPGGEPEPARTGGFTASLRVGRVVLRRALRRGIAVSVRCSDACRVTLRGRGLRLLRLRAHARATLRGRLRLTGRARRQPSALRRLVVRGVARASASGTAVPLRARVRVHRR